MLKTTAEISAELEAAVEAEAAAANALAELEDSARAGHFVSPVDLAGASGELQLRRLRRERLEADVAAAAERATAAVRTAALHELASRAAANPALNQDRLRELEQAAHAAAQNYADALRKADKAFRDLAEDAAKLGVRVAGKDASDADVLIAGAEWRSGRTVRYGDPVRVRLAGAEYAPPSPKAFAHFAKWVGGVVN